MIIIQSIFSEIYFHDKIIIYYNKYISTYFRNIDIYILNKYQVFVKLDCFENSRFSLTLPLP